MHEDLRRRALESRKTTSRKARSKQSSTGSSTANSRANSRVTSRTTSRDASDDEDDDLSDSMAWSTNSIDNVLASVEQEPQYRWQDELANRISQIVERQRSSNQGREEDLAAFSDPLLSAFLRTVRSAAGEKESLLGLTAISMMIITLTSADIYDTCLTPLKNLTASSANEPTKTEAIHTLGLLVFFADADEGEIQETMTFLLDIIETDGNSIDAADSAEVVTAALDVWGFLATQIEDMEEASPPAVEAFTEQLESGDAGVQIASGENIALLYEKSYTEIESDEEVGQDDREPDLPPPTYLKRYDPYRRKDQLLNQLDGLATSSSRRVSKKDRKNLHSSFAGIRQTVETPTKGPKYSSAIDEETEQEYGSRLKVKVTGDRSMRIDTWWKLHRLKALRRVLKNGFLEHYERNEIVIDTLPVLTT